jgi:hypothetical protein
MLVDGPQFDGGVRESGGDLAQQRAQTRLERGLRHRIRLHVPWARFEEACAQAP